MKIIKKTKYGFTFTHEEFEMLTDMIHCIRIENISSWNPDYFKKLKAFLDDFKKMILNRDLKNSLGEN